MVTFNAAMSALEKGSRWTLALHLLQRLKSGHRPELTSYNACMSACEKASRWQQAIALLLELHDLFQPDVVSITACVAACAAASRWQQVLLIAQGGNAATYDAAVPRPHFSAFCAYFIMFHPISPFFCSLLPVLGSFSAVGHTGLLRTTSMRNPIL